MNFKPKNDSQWILNQKNNSRWISDQRKDSWWILGQRNDSQWILIFSKLSVVQNENFLYDKVLNFWHSCRYFPFFATNSEYAKVGLPRSNRLSLNFVSPWQYSVSIGLIFFSFIFQIVWHPPATALRQTGRGRQGIQRCGPHLLLHARVRWAVGPAVRHRRHPPLSHAGNRRRGHARPRRRHIRLEETLPIFCFSSRAALLRISPLFSFFLFIPHHTLFIPHQMKKQILCFFTFNLSIWKELMRDTWWKSKHPGH